jgi:aromatic-L-amino-acid/L-tryptophan decarboxylase
VDLDSFRREAHRLADWMADYLAGVERLPVRSQLPPGAVAAQLPDGPPAAPEPFPDLMADLERVILPGLTHWQHPRFLAYFPANSSPPSLLAEMLTATFGAQCMLWQTSPAATELEARVLDWLRQMIGLPEGFAGVIQDSASSATLCAVLTARERATGWRGNADGLRDLPPLAVYCSEEAHSSAEKAVRIAGLGSASLRKVPADAALAMRPDALAEAIRADRAAGVTPACIVATLGTTSTGAFDPLPPIVALAREHGAYLHVDAAWAGSALVCPEQRAWAAGLDLADSLVLNPHKWLLTNFDCSAHLVRCPDELVRTLAINPAYLQTREGSAVTDYRDWGIPLGRRFRALKLWFVIRAYGVEGLQSLIRRHIALARELAAWIEADPDFELTSGPSLALLTFRYRPQGVDDEATLDALNARLLEAVNDDGRTYLTQTRLRGRYVIRASIGQTTTERRHVEEAWAAVREIARGLGA